MFCGILLSSTIFIYYHFVLLSSFFHLLSSSTFMLVCHGSMLVFMRVQFWRAAFFFGESIRPIPYLHGPQSILFPFSEERQGSYHHGGLVSYGARSSLVPFFSRVFVERLPLRIGAPHSQHVRPRRACHHCPADDRG